jgi:hypothetical protein
MWLDLIVVGVLIGLGVLISLYIWGLKQAKASVKPDKD